MKRALAVIWFCWLLGGVAAGQGIRVNPVGVNVNPSGATTVLLTFGGVKERQGMAEALWCGELIPAAPDFGFKCDPTTVYGALPARYDLSRRGRGGRETDIMSIPPSVARRAYQAAAAGEDSRFFYVRRFTDAAGGPDEYVAVTCRLAGGGARVPLALTEVKLTFEPDRPIVFVKPGEPPPPLKAVIRYNGTGRLKGRWEVVMPGEEPPTDFDLLTEATLPYEERPQQRRFTQVSRFNLFLPPVGRVTLPGPDVKLLPRTTEGAYLVLLRVEASDDKEGDSDLAAVGAGPGVVHNGAVAGFALPVLRYYVGGDAGRAPGSLVLLAPGDAAVLPRGQPVVFTWAEAGAGATARVEILDSQERPVLSALLPAGAKAYRAPSWLGEKLLDKTLRWRVVMLDEAGRQSGVTAWRVLRLAPAGALYPANN